MKNLIGGMICLIGYFIASTIIGFIPGLLIIYLGILVIKIGDK